MDLSESKYEDLVEKMLGAVGYRAVSSTAYDAERCLIPSELLDFVQTTQQDAWRKLVRASRSHAADRLLDRVSRDISAQGTSYVLHEGVKVGDVKFRLAFFQPDSLRNEVAARRAEQNLFAVVRQLSYGTRPDQAGRSIDCALFLNGLPLFAIELKTHLTGQTARSAIVQWQRDRDRREPLFRQGRCLAFFAVDEDVVQFATTLRGEKTVFWPFNQGKFEGAGNPPTRGYPTEYLWRRVFAPASVLRLVQHFVHLVEDEDQDGRKTGSKTLLFPRYHQWDAVNRAVADARAKGVGERYLFQHSAGSGKSNTIAWLANLLSLLHDADDMPVFNSVVVLTDRKVLDRQLQTTLRRLQRTAGVLTNIDKHSQQLREALERGKKVIVTTVQKFPVIADQIARLPGERFALIIDEAHQGQGPKTTKALGEALSGEALDLEEGESSREGIIEAKVVEAMRERRWLTNASVFAFTATPGPKTLQLFGTRSANGEYRPFSLYSRRQAIEEGFILDVLGTYLTYEAYWRLIKKIDDDPTYDRAAASSVIKNLVRLDESMIAEKVAVALEAFQRLANHKIGGRAKAMYVCSSRPQAILVKDAVDAWLQRCGAPYKALVAFSDTIRHPLTGEEMTESRMNGLPESQTAAAFKRDQYRLLVVANKFQTGFDQPLLHTMIVDKRLLDANAVQTLERLNRTCAEKEDTLVLDFVNDADDIRDAFQRFHGETYLGRGTDPDTLHELETEIRADELFEFAEVDQFAAVFFGGETDQSQLLPVLASAVDRYEAADERTRARFRSRLGEYVRIYGFIAQIIDFADSDLEKLYVWAHALLSKLPTPEGDLPVGLQAAIDLESLRVRKTGEHVLTLDKGGAMLEPVQASQPATPSEREVVPLSAILKDLNDHFGMNLTEEDRLTLLRVEARLDESGGLEKAFDVNPVDDARMIFDDVADHVLNDLLTSNVRFLRTVANETEVKERLMDRLLERYVQRHSARGHLSADRRQALAREIPELGELVEQGDASALAEQLSSAAARRRRGARSRRRD